MSDSIFKEVVFTPHIFKKENLLKNERQFERLLNILDNLAESGQIIGLFSEWFKFVNENISQLEEFDKSDVEEILKFLNDRQRLVQIIDRKCEIENENAWIEQALKLHSYRNFEAIFATSKKNDILTISEVDRRTIKLFQNKGAKVLPQSKENMKKLLSPILAYADIVKVYDPYFDLTKPRYDNALKIITQTLGYRHGEQIESILEIHTSIKTMLDKDSCLNWKLLTQYIDKIIQYEKIYKHEITFYIWEDKKDNKWHDRWIVTNQCAVTLGKGSDISEWTDATWGLLDYEEIPNVERKFQINRNEFKLIAKIDKNGYKKVNRSLQYSEARSIEELEEKLKKTPKNFRKNK